MSNMFKFKVHFTDDYGYACIECDTRAEAYECFENLQADPKAEGVWIEYPYDEDGGY